MSVILLAALALAGAEPDPAARAILATNPVMIADPQWAMRPTPLEMTRAYPHRAMRNEKQGEARLICRVGADGAVKACGVLSESLSGYEFGRAALTLVSKFRMTPKTLDGVVIDNAAVIVPVRFMIRYPNFTPAKRG